MAMAALPSVWVLIVASLLLHSTVSAFEFRVGGEKGWTKPHGDAAENYNHWALQNRFQVGDSLCNIIMTNPLCLSNCYMQKLIVIWLLIASRFQVRERLFAGGDEGGLQEVLHGEPSAQVRQRHHHRDTRPQRPLLLHQRWARALRGRPEAHRPHWLPPGPQGDHAVAGPCALLRPCRRLLCCVGACQCCNRGSRGSPLLFYVALASSFRFAQPFNWLFIYFALFLATYFLINFLVICSLLFPY